jgi:hypothetical protein
MLSRLWSRAWSPSWRILTVVVLLLVLHSLWGYVEARRLQWVMARITAESRVPPRTPRDRLDDAARFYEAAWALEPGLPIRAKDRDEQIQKQRDFETLRATEPSLEMLDRGAALAACRFQWQEDRLPPLLAIRKVGSANSLRTRERLARGDAAGALQSIVSSFRHLRVFEGDVSLIGHLMRMVLLQMALDDTKLYLEHAPPGADRAPLTELVEAQMLPNAIETAFTAERAWMVREMGRSIDTGFHIPHADNWILRPLVRHFGVTILDFISRTIEASRAPWPERIRQVEAMRRPWGAAGQVYPSLERSAMSLARSTSLTHAMADCLSVERYREAHGRLPEVIEGVHVDPFTGQPLKYRREELGYVIYSLGENGKDDGGLVDDKIDGGLPSDYGYRIHIRP